MIWLEAALNGPWGMALQPLAPIAVDAIVRDALEAVDHGAAIIHVHAYDTASGLQTNDWQVYARIIEGVRARSDALVYPTIPMRGLADVPAHISSAERYAHVEELGKRGLIEIAVVDPGSVNIARFDAVGSADPGWVYQNTPADFAAGLRAVAGFGVHPSYALYEPGHTRLAAAFEQAQPGLRRPIYRFMFSDEFAFGVPVEKTFLDAHLALLERCAPGATWMAAGLGVDILPLVPAVVARAGHVRVGLEDAPLGTHRGNAEWTRLAAAAIVQAGGSLASPKDVRAALSAPRLTAGGMD